ncbi:MBL fold metallo-hydrolase [Sphingomonas sp. GlSt437]|uniref:MBL fold metallo-hydrolase n=1 Tax=Sphingomonas sp. GlSt437 TaxID=3389970 RepID=UPI003A8AF851
MARTILARLGAGLLWLVIIAALALAIVPHFLDAIYYRGPVTSHFDGHRFYNPDGDPLVLPPAGRQSRAQFITHYLTGRQLGGPWPDHVAIHPIDPPARVDGSRMVATWVGHATVLVQTQGLNILTDPVWAQRSGPFDIGPARVAAPGIAFDKLPKIDIVLVSHDHYDHMDLGTLKKLWARDHPVIVTSLGNDRVIGAAGVKAAARDWGGRVNVRPGIDVIVSRSHHWGSRWFTDRDRALWSSFVVTLPGGNLFFAGDTGAGDLHWPVEAAAYGPVRLALIPIGAFRFEPGQMESGAHIGPVDAVEVFRRLGAARGIGVHWGTFHLSREAYDTPPKLLAAAMACTGQGGTFDTVPIGVPREIAPYAPPAPKPVMPRDALLRCLDTPAVRALQ